MKIIYNKYIPTKNFKAINLFGLILARTEYGKLTKEEENHEAIHTAQAFELLFVFFYIFYLTEWIFRLIQYRDRLNAYYNISFEREAYSNQNNLNYLRRRRFFSFRKYYRKKKPD